MRRRALLPSLASAQQKALPARPPTLVTSFPPGGIVDTAGRILAPAGVRLGHDLRARFGEFVMEAQFQTDPELANVLGMETRLWGGLIRDVGVRAE